MASQMARKAPSRTSLTTRNRQSATARPPAAVRAAAVSDDGAAVASAASKRVKVWSDDARLLEMPDAAKAAPRVCLAGGSWSRASKLWVGGRRGAGDTKEARDSDGSVAHAGAVLSRRVRDCDGPT